MSNKIILDKITNYDEVYEYDFYSNDFDSNDLANIFKNIDNFTNLLNDYAKILFIYDNSPENLFVDKIIIFLANKFYIKAINFVLDQELDNELKKMNYIPDIIIYKSCINFDFRKIFDVPIIYLISNIFMCDLKKQCNELEHDEYDRYINKNIINQIEKSDISFSDNLYTKKILEEKYNLKTYLFYSEFVSFYGKNIENDVNFENRKYQYGIIADDFNLKNIQKSIDFLKNKEKVILIGKNSNKYKEYGFKCIDIAINNSVNDYYYNIKYIIQNSYYEPNNHVKIESIFKGCKIFKKKKILLTSTQYPGYGGAATNIYKIIELLKNEYYDVYGVFFHNNLNVNYNPNNLTNIFIFDTKYFKNNSCNLIHEKILELYQKIGEPDIILAKNYEAPKFIKMIYPFSKIYYLLSGLNHFPKFYNNMSAYEFDKLDNINGKIQDEEYVLKICYGVILNSQLTQKLFNKIYNYSYDKQLYIDTTLLTYYNNINEILNIESKIYDIVISCSRLDRIDKNNLWLIELLKEPYFNDKKILIVGNNNDKFKILNLDITYYDLVSNKEMINLFKISKLLLFPSLYDSNSNTVLEALINKCFPITTKNVGNSYYLNEDFLCDDKKYDVEEWKNKIQYILNNYKDYFNNYDINSINNLIIKNYNMLIDLIENTQKNKIIITSSQYPGYGGAATNCYNIHNYLLKNNYDSVCIFLENFTKMPNFNPLNLPNTYLFKRDKLDTDIVNNFNPDIIFCKNYYCPYYFHKVFGNKYTIYYLVAGSIHASFNADLGNSCDTILKMNDNDIMLFLNNIPKNSQGPVKMELDSMDNSDFVLANSSLSYNLLNKIYKNHKDKILNVTDTSIYSELVSTDKIKNILKRKIRKYDLCIICSILDRKIKNFDFVYKLFSEEEMFKYNKVVIGNNNNNLYDFKNKNITHFEHLTNNDIFSILLDTKILLIPSLFDASPNIANEASKCGCRIITSNNVGNIKNDYIVINNYDISNWIINIKNLIG